MEKLLLLLKCSFLSGLRLNLMHPDSYWSVFTVWGQLRQHLVYVLFVLFPCAICTLAFNSHIKTVKHLHLIEKNYSRLILINIIICTIYCLMLGNFFRSSTDHKQRANGGGGRWNRQSCLKRRPGKYMKYVSFSRPPLEAALSVFNVEFLFNTHFWGRTNESKGYCHQCRIISCIKCLSWKDPFCGSLDRDVTKNLTLRIYIYIIPVYVCRAKWILCSLIMFCCFCYWPLSCLLITFKNEN